MFASFVCFPPILCYVLNDIYSIFVLGDHQDDLLIMGVRLEMLLFASIFICAFLNLDRVSTGPSERSSKPMVQKCGRRESTPFAESFSRIVGGEPCTSEFAPWQVSLKNKGSHFCGASIISEDWIVTAAHCCAVFPRLRVTSVTAVVGSDNLRKASSNEQILKIDIYRIHPQFDSSNPVNYDICVIRVTEKIVFGSSVQPICLPSPDTNFQPGTLCTVSGWGKTSEGGTVSQTLQRVHLPLLPTAECNLVLINAGVGEIDVTMLCAGFPEGGRDACQGDSGGPLFCQQGTGPWFLMGVTSWGIGCARKWSTNDPNHSGTPGIFANVKALITYIFEQTSSISRASLDLGECDSRGMTLEGESGTLRYPMEQGSEYTNGSVCSWVVEVPKDFQIEIKILWLDIEKQPLCRSDYLALYSENGDLLGKICGNTPPAPFLTESNKVELQFVSDISYSGKGFELQYTAVLKSGSGCGSIAKLNQPGTIDSFNYPFPYSANSDCIWKVVAGMNQVVKIRFIDFEVEESLDCTYDSVSIFNDFERHLPIAKLCGDSIPGPFWSSSNKILIEFKSDNENHFRGFKALVTFEQPGTQNSIEVKPTKSEEILVTGHITGTCGVPARQALWKDSCLGKMEQVVPYSYPWHVGLSYRGVVWCSGAVLSRQWIVTAASCFKHSSSLSHWKVVAGDHDYQLDEKTEQVLEVLDILMHPNFTLYNSEYNIAMVKVQEVIVDEYVSPVCLPDRDNTLEPSSICILTGRGILDGQLVSRLQQCYLPIHDSNITSESMGTGKISNTMLCAGFPGSEITAFSQGEVGDPLVCLKDGKYTLYGLQSGLTCGEGSWLFSRVRVMLDWIEAVQAKESVIPDNVATLDSGECPDDQPLISPQGSFHSPGYPYYYDGCLNCSWTVYSSLNSQVVLDIIEISIMESPNCEKAYLSICEESNDGARHLLGRFCGRLRDITLSASQESSVVKIIFVTDHPAKRKGFFINYAVKQIEFSTSGKEHKIKKASEEEFNLNAQDVLLLGPADGEIKSPGYPNNYSLNTCYSYRIVGPPNTVIRIDFNFFRTLVIHDFCVDYLDIFEGVGSSENLLGHFYGEGLPPSVKSSGSEMTIVFNASCNFTDSGFVLQYFFLNVSEESINLGENEKLAACPEFMLLKELPGELKSPNYPNPYYNNLKCVWTIYTTSGHRILVKIKDFSLEDGKTAWDKLIIHDGPNVDAVIIDTLSGTQNPRNLISSGNFVTLVLETDASVVGHGFRIEYSDTTQSTNINPGIQDMDKYPCGFPKFRPWETQAKGMQSTEAFPYSMPWVTSLQANGIHYCIGALIHPEWVIAPWHCNFNTMTDKVVLGAYDLSSEVESLQHISVKEKYEHEDCGGFPPSNDIILLHLTRPVQLGDTVIPVCLPEEDFKIDDDWSCLTAGWRNVDPEVKPRNLIQTSVSFLNQSECLEYWGGNVKHFNLCIGPSGSASCIGDSGGLLTCQKGGQHFLIGTVSWGSATCLSTAPAVYTEVSFYRSWIMNITKEVVNF
ncbi:ovochymase-2-like isoform X1 [Polypterus senegalus]|uniref:ovochymase-2-like isoform X1 n=1 Tax=Polypterus senegalus TaxID=55291 RepID=UPI001963E521|nr:ovochymase-2-like isoform X1 [Polypterus senegalus]